MWFSWWIPEVVKLGLAVAGPHRRLVEAVYTPTIGNPCLLKQLTIAINAIIAGAFTLF
jgi:hypothetical protein